MNTAAKWILAGVFCFSVSTARVEAAPYATASSNGSANAICQGEPIVVSFTIHDSPPTPADAGRAGNYITTECIPTLIPCLGGKFSVSKAQPLKDFYGGNIIRSGYFTVALNAPWPYGSVVAPTTASDEPVGSYKLHLHFDTTYGAKTPGLSSENQEIQFNQFAHYSVKPGTPKFYSGPSNPGSDDPRSPLYWSNPKVLRVPKPQIATISQDIYLPITISRANAARIRERANTLKAALLQYRPDDPFNAAPMEEELFALDADEAYPTWASLSTVNSDWQAQVALQLQYTHSIPSANILIKMMIDKTSSDWSKSTAAGSLGWMYSQSSSNPLLQAYIKKLSERYGLKSVDFFPLAKQQHSS